MTVVEDLCQSGCDFYGLKLKENHEFIFISLEPLLTNHMNYKLLELSPIAIVWHRDKLHF